MSCAKLAAVCVVWLIAGGAAGCTVRSPSELSLESIETTDYYGLRSFPPLSDWIRYEDGEEVVMRDQRAFVVTFSSHYNIAEFANGIQGSMYLKTYFCDRPFDPARLSSIFFYWRGFEINPRDQQLLAKMRGPRDNAPFRYYTYMFAQRYEHGPEASAYLSYDLRKEPEDVCFHLHGSNLDFRYKSNVITIPASMIEAALDNEPPGLAK